MIQSNRVGWSQVEEGEIRKRLGRPLKRRNGTRQMESVNKIKEALSQRSRTATLDQLRNEGRKRVRLIRAEHVAQMISQAVHQAIKQSGLIKPGEVDDLVEKSRTEFKKILGEREQELQGSRDIAERLEQTELDLTETKSRFRSISDELAGERAKLEQANHRLQKASADLSQATGELSRINQERERANSGIKQANSQLDHASSELRESNDKLQRSNREVAEANSKLDRASSELRESNDKLEQSNREVVEANSQLEEANSQLEELREIRDNLESKLADPPQATVSSDMMMSIMEELTNLKASVATQQQQPAAPVGGADLTAALEKISGGLSDKLEKIGKKMGVSGAVEGDVTPDFSSMMKDGDEVQLESNMDNIKIKQKSAGGIAANLARLKKLKDGGS